MSRKRPTEEQTTQLPYGDAEITSANVKNANASGDGAVQKSDELLEREENDEESNDEVY
jgi:hypothetical protein